MDLIMSRAQPKQYRGQYVTGSALAAFAQAYVDVINKGQVPAISSTWQVGAACHPAFQDSLRIEEYVCF